MAKMFRKIVWSALAVLVFTVSGMAQIKLGGTFGIPYTIGEFGDVTQNIGVRYGIQAKYMVKPKVAVGLNVQRNRFAALGGELFDSTGKKYGDNLLPVNVDQFYVCGEYYFATDWDENFWLYAGAELGPVLYTTGIDEYNAVEFKNKYSTKSDIYFGGGAYVGINIPITELVDFNSHLTYNFFQTEKTSGSFVGLNVGAVITIGQNWKE